MKQRIVWQMAITTTVFAFAMAGCQSTATRSGRDTSRVSEFDQGTSGSDEIATWRSAGGSLKLDSVYFTFNRWSIRSDAEPTLKSNARQITSSSGNGVLTIEGHCDERGSEEYNLALGERRATAVRNYLVDLGVPSGRLRTVSYGEAKPAVRGHDESAWRWNRRSEFRTRR